ncbi:MAG: hypothetical protein HRT99_03930, partial [Mycoplasmatales bacterium]|nr:hypothetical protein [Mycoplasmatales bacterium]
YSHNPNNNKIWYIKFKLNGYEYNYDLILLENDKSIIKTSHLLGNKINVSSTLSDLIGKILKIEKFSRKNGYLPPSDVFDLSYLANEYYENHQTIFVEEFNEILINEKKKSADINKVSFEKAILKEDFFNVEKIESYKNVNLQFQNKIGIYSKDYTEKIFNDWRFNFKKWTKEMSSNENADSFNLIFGDKD